MDTIKPPIADSTPAFALTLGELRELVRKEVQTIGSGPARHPTLLTPEELANQFKVPISWVYEQSRQGKIPTHRIGRYIRFDSAEVLIVLSKKRSGES